MASKNDHEATTNVIAYLRVSTDEQAKEGVSLPAQRHKIEAYASLYNLHVVEWLADEGVSAKTLDRPNLTKTIELIKSGIADGLVVAKLDRLTRSIGDWNYLIEKYFSKDVKLFSVSDQVDTRTASGRMVLNILMTVAQWERETISERTSDALQHKKSNGERVGSVPYGYRLSEDGQHTMKKGVRKCLNDNPECKGCKNLEPDEQEQAVVSKIIELFDEGKCTSAIAGYLSSVKILTRSGKDFQAIQVQRIINEVIRREKT